MLFPTLMLKRASTATVITGDRYVSSHRITTQQGSIVAIVVDRLNVELFMFRDVFFRGVLGDPDTGR